ncbi:aromatic ring-hydroxylating oxygenase subunit alpha [Streptomyces albireticuli]|uniref:Biphenyl 2,3-dioxygenase n=1 Tax=Streptomyces albireticuli TaxID=1940 RepID=A0A2A2D8Z7_9ACTN|nr:aromatic ring-hydroxylating dioxygenase subunit alpha [Streptomyces albireticuli]MCD9194588.1 aromatic ring-hydroxylating dioxygenase subunit alpha [Streptomyces albireticuli]PAU47782.1 biphenyl 2,3-dioxygenase [Streptomyces albireticuli]
MTDATDMTGHHRGTPVPALLEELRRLAALPLERGETLPPEAYTSPEWYGREIERIFRKEWLCVARADEVPEPGSYLRLDVLGTPLVITRDEGGELHALSRVCRHRFMDVLPPENTPGKGSLKRLVCPYHTWTYRLNGRYAGQLAGAPLMHGVEFERASCRLPAYRLAVWNGFVLLSLDPRAPSPDAGLAGLDRVLAGYGLDRWESVVTLAWEDVPANWKVAVENGSENYHHMGTHAATLEPVLPGKDTRVDACDGRWFTMFTPFAAAPGERRPEDGEEAPGLLIAGIFPQFVLAVLRDSAVWIRWLPTGPASHDARLTALVPPGASGAPGFTDSLEEVRRQLTLIQEEDLVAIRGVQRGLNSRPAPSNGRFSHLERPLWQFQRYLAERLL